MAESFLCWALVSSPCLPSSREDLGEQQIHLDAAVAWMEKLHTRTPTQHLSAAQKHLTSLQKESHGNAMVLLFLSTELNLH